MHSQSAATTCAALIAALFFSALGCAPRANPASAALGNAAAAALSLAPSPPIEEVPYVQTPHHVVHRMLQLADVRRGETLWDLGSGDGRIVIEAARRGAQATGFEIDPSLVAESKALAGKAKLAARTKFVTKDLFTLDFRAADIVTMYLLPEYNLTLRARLLSQLKPGARIVSHEWDMGDWPADETLTVWSAAKPHGTQKEHRVYLWVIPANISGHWRFVIRDTNAGGAKGPKRHTFDANIEQSYQRLDMNASAGVIRWAQLRGRDLSFRYENGGFQATVYARVSADGKRVTGRNIRGTHQIIE